MSTLTWYKTHKINFKQECIPVGCIPATHRLYAGFRIWGGWVAGVVSGPGGGGVCSRGCLLPGGLSAPRGVPGLGGMWCLVWGGLVRGWLLPGEVSGLGVWCLVWGVSALGGSASVPSGIPTTHPPPPPGGWGVCLSAFWGTNSPPMNIMTNRCKNITLATTSLRPVINFKGVNLQVVAWYIRRSRHCHHLCLDSVSVKCELKNYFHSCIHVVLLVYQTTDFSRCIVFKNLF